MKKKMHQCDHRCSYCIENGNVCCSVCKDIGCPKCTESEAFQCGRLAERTELLQEIEEWVKIYNGKDASDTIRRIVLTDLLSYLKNKK